MIYLDFETTNHSYGSALDPRNEIVMVSWCVDEGPIRNYTGKIMDAREFWRDMDSATSACAFNSKFEMLWLIRLGFDVTSVHWHDPMLAERVLNGNRDAKLSLDAVATKYGYSAKDPMIDSLMKSGVCPSDMPQKRLAARCNRDVRTTRSIMKRQMLALGVREQVHIYRTRADFCTFLAGVEYAGMELDSERVYAEYEKQSKSLATVERRLNKITGGINLRSPDQKAHFLYGKLKFPERKGARGKPLRNKPSKQFPNGRPKTDQATMQWLAGQAKTDAQKEFIGLIQLYGKCNAKLTKNLQFFKGVCDERGGKFHAQFNQTVAATHRLTSSGIPIEFAEFGRKSTQFQNMPREYKRLFKAPKGYKIYEVDSAQLEFRVAAFLGQDEQALKDIADPDFDAHCTSASVMEDIPYESFLSAYRGETTPTAQKAAKNMRTRAKADTFKPLFGGTKGTEKQERWYKEFQNRYNGIYTTQEGWVAQVQVDGVLRLPWGMVFEWDVKTNRNGVLMNTKTHKPVGPQIFNYPVQSLATAEIVPIAIMALAKRCREQGLDVTFINTVHDSVIAYVKDDNKTRQQFSANAKLAFTKDVYEHLELHYGIDFNVPLGCGITPGDHWGDGEELTYDDVDNRRKAA